MKLYLESGKTKEGVAEGDKLLKAYPGEERYVMAFADVLAKNNQLPIAVDHLERFVAENEEVGNARMLLAGFYRDSQEETKARNLLMEVFDDPSVELGSKIIVLGAYNTELNQSRSKNIRKEEKETFVISLYEKLEKDNPQEASVHILGGDLFLSTGRDHEAIGEYIQAIELGDVNYEVWQNLLYLEAKVNQFDNLIKHSDQALEYFPNQAMIYYFNGYGHLRKQHNEEAVAALEQAKKLSPGNTKFLAEVNGMLGDTYNTMKQYDKSDKSYEEALSLDPESDVILNNYSYYLALRKENLEKAEKMSTQLTKNNPNNPTYLDTHAWVLYMKGKYKEARKVMERAIQAENVSATLFEHYGDILFKLGDVNGAVEQWEKAKETDANNELLNKKIANRKIYE
jgi:tetratricopeptide (TPR) repeat protein